MPAMLQKPAPDIKTDAAKSFLSGAVAIAAPTILSLLTGQTNEASEASEASKRTPPPPRFQWMRDS